MDVATIAVQVCGAALVGIVYSKQARGESTPVTTETANNILRAGLAVQVSEEVQQSERRTGRSVCAWERAHSPHTLLPLACSHCHNLFEAQLRIFAPLRLADCEPDRLVYWLPFPACGRHLPHKETRTPC